MKKFRNLWSWIIFRFCCWIIKPEHQPVPFTSDASLSDYYKLMCLTKKLPGFNSEFTTTVDRCDVALWIAMVVLITLASLLFL